MLPVNCGSHTDYQDFVVTHLRKYYPDPDALARSTWDIIERFWNLDLWMFSDGIDDEDLEFMSHDYVTYNMACEYYRLGIKPVVRMAHEAGAVYKIGKKVLIRRSIKEQQQIAEVVEKAERGDDS